jgi:hypothetical protein
MKDSWSGRGIEPTIFSSASQRAGWHAAAHPRDWGTMRRRPRRAVWLAPLLACAAAALPAPATAAPVSSHAELYSCCTPYALKDRIFAESQAMGASYIRVDVQMSDIFATPNGPPDWRRLDEVIALSRRYGIRVLAIILETPTWLSNCPTSAQPGHCPPRDFGQYGGLVGRLAAHARGAIRHWQILNEPWYPPAFTGTPEDYGRILSASHDAIKRAAPEDLVVLGNAYPNQTEWANRVFATAGAARKFDIGTVNLRGKLRDMSNNFRGWQGFLAQQGFRGPIWVVEHGYPADPEFQFDPAFTGGDAAQAAYLRRSLRDIEASGAAEVFVTLRHGDTNQYVSEGIVDIGAAPGYPASRKPAFIVVRDWANEWHQRQATYRERAAWHLEQARRYSATAAESATLAERARRRARSARRRERRYLRRAKKLRAAARRDGLCFERTAAPACGRRAARERAKATRAQRRAKKAGETCRRHRRAAGGYLWQARTYRRQAALHTFQARGYAQLIKPLL